VKVGVEEIATIRGRIEHTGEGYDVVHLKRTGSDGPGKRVAFSEDRRARGMTGALTSRNPKVPLRHEESDWTIFLHGLLYERGRESRGEELLVPMSWMVQRGEFSCAFGGGVVVLYPSAEAADEGRALRMGPPFTYDLRATSRGHDAVLRVKLHDENGGQLGTGRNEREHRKIHVRLAQDGVTKHEADVEYG
jgi:hypothetical protein